ncbi:MAG: hypothetical protein ACYS9T_05235 [Planctomycetota bacterium]|jgi:hypothetical protein
MTQRTSLSTFLVFLQLLALPLAQNVWATCDGFDTTAVNKLTYDLSGDDYGGDLYLTDSNYIVVDDMESYNDSNNYIWDTWLDGCGDANGAGGNGTGSCIYLAIDPCDPVHGGAQSMAYYYDNCNHGWRCGGYSEITAGYDPPVDWTSHGEKALVLWFRGSAGNGSTPMWVMLHDGAPTMATYGDNGEDPEDITKEEWVEWNIKLSDFADGGVDLTDVAGISIGFGDPSDYVGDGTTGIVYFDDIRLYPARCVERFAPPADFTGDCAVNGQDLEVIAQEWLYAGGETVEGDIAEYDATTPGTTTVYAASDDSGCQASGPSPDDGQTKVQSARTEVTLCWMEAECVAPFGRNYLYFGTGFDDVNSAPEYSVGWDPPEEFVGFLPAGDNCYSVGALPLWKAYYWRVDEKCVDGSYCKGNVWSFTTGCDLAASDVNIDCLVNFADFTTLAGSWLEQAPLWPPE